MLTGKQRRYLRSLGHHLQPVVQLGKEGPSDGIVAATLQALRDHELIKVRLLGSAGEDRRGIADELAASTESEVAQVLGRTLLLYKPHPEEPTIVLPGAGAPGEA